MNRDEDTRKAEFEAAYNELSEPIFRHFYYRLRNRERAKELMQETFTRAWGYLAEGTAVRMMKPFLYTVANNLFKNEIRTDKRTRSLEEMHEEQGFDPAEQEDVEQAAEIRNLMRYLERLDPDFRDVLVMRYIDDLSISEIAKILGKSDTAITVRIHRARRALKAIYEPDEPTETT